MSVTLRAPALVALFLLFAAGVAAETVMISVQDETDIQDDDYRSASRYHLSAVEDGVMDAFFDAGHIVFNFGEYEQPAGESMQRRYNMRKAARGGGASMVVQLSLVFERIDEESLKPIGIDYELWEVESGEALAAGRRSAPFGFSDENSKPGSRSAELGRRVARELLSKL
jgi:hypothetical protein